MNCLKWIKSIFRKFTLANTDFHGKRICTLNYCDLSNLVVYSLLLENVNRISRKILLKFTLVNISSIYIKVTKNKFIFLF